MVKQTGALLLLPLLALSACTQTSTPSSTTNDVGGLSDEALLVRASLDLRGVRPSESERAAVANDDVSATIDTFLDDPRFFARVKDIFAPAFRTRIDRYRIGDFDGRYNEPAVQEAVSEEVLNLMAWVAVNDRPWTEVVTSPVTVVSPVLLPLWPLQTVEGADEFADLPAPPEGLVLARYVDGRAAAGVLADNAVYWRHTSTVENANRGRANAITRALLCEDYLARPIDFPRDVDLTDSDSIHAAIRENPACQACHSTLDPFASHVWGFMYRVDDSAVWSNYHASQELDWRATTETGPGYFGTASTTVSSLANKVANDERFVGCAVRRAFEGLMGRPATLDDDGALADHREVFLRSGLSMKALLKDIVHSPTYRGRAAHPHFGGQPAPVAHKTISPELLHTELLALTGVSVVVDGREALFVDHGLRALAGGSDRGSAALPSTGLVLAQRVLAENAANRLLDALGAEAGTVEEGATGDDVNLDSVLGQFLRSVDVQQRPTAEQAQRLLTLTTGRTLTSDDASALLALYDDVEALSPNGGWSALLTVALADPDLLLY